MTAPDVAAQPPAGPPPDGDDLTDLMTDRDATHRASSLPPGSVRLESIARLREAARPCLPDCSRSWFSTRSNRSSSRSTISGSMVNGRVCLIGDAAFNARPHAEAGHRQSRRQCQDARRGAEPTRAGCLRGTARLGARPAGPVPTGRTPRPRPGDAQFGPGFAPGDPSFLFGLYGVR